ncbi:MAG TPA: efflux RND transporter periplasmic adaptor subunit [Terriglobales bacterium]|nr:efflux RND transporter periplasmic adaptor subunit [Terriglobales bacterium]
MNRLLPFIALLSACTLLLLTGCAEKASPAPVADAVPVMAAKAVVKPMPVELHAIGTGEAFKTVSVESQVAGIVSAVHYQQGQYVKQGDLLISLDDRPFVAALKQAEANLAKDKAAAELAKVEVERYSKLSQAGVVPREQYDQQRANFDAAQAAVQADEANIQTAKLNVAYCSIYAPISGRTGSQLVYPGTVVKANDVPVLVVINEVSPLYVDFNVPQQYLTEIKSYMAKGRLPVQAVPSDNSHTEVGYLSFVDNTVDPSTGNIKLKATFTNAGLRLWPGEFVNAILRLTQQENAVVVPAQAVLTGQQGDYIFFIKPDMTVDSHPVKVLRTINGESVVAANDVQPGQMVVTDGQVRLVPGVKVSIKNSL